MPGPSYRSELEQARSTAAHNTLAIKGVSSGSLLRSDFLKDQAGGFPIRTPANVTAKTHVEGDLILFEGSHDGYRASHGMIHKRRLILDRNGRRLVGRDEIGAPKHALRLAKDAPFAVHFHLHPSITCQFEGDDANAQEHKCVLLNAPNGEVWKFDTQESRLTIEDSVHFAEAAGPRESLQIVLRGASFGASRLEWRLERIK